MRGRASPHRRRGPNPVPNPGQLSPGRLELLTSSVERCRSRPARITPGTPSPLALRGARRPRWPGHPDRAAPRPSCRRGTPPCPAHAPGPAFSRHPAHTYTTPSKTPGRDHHRTSNESLPGSLDNRLLTLVRSGSPHTSASRAGVLHSNVEQFNHTVLGAPRVGYSTGAHRAWPCIRLSVGSQEATAGAVAERRGDTMLLPVALDASGSTSAITGVPLKSSSPAGPPDSFSRQSSGSRNRLGWWRNDREREVADASSTPASLSTCSQAGPE